ncbi:ATP-binding protein [Burkholderia diffusa]|uniref:ATP-binding protein n=1 Tax=Burkholderia diffusa TaxID=488732 RepID=UPI001FD0DEFA|nr:ATP-binding protein [Burkholderia diffusa]
MTSLRRWIIKIQDSVDGSGDGISANASTVRIEYDASQEPFVAILDDGHGMDAAELTNAMRHGSRNPAEIRSSQDLGRFGLGLKTASLAQCRKLTVVSKQGDNIHARCWDRCGRKLTIEHKRLIITPM